MPHSFLSLTKYRIRSRVRISRANAPIVFFDRTHKWGRDTRALSGNAAIEQARDDHLKKSGFADGLFWLCFNYALVKFYWMPTIFEAARRVRRPSVRVTGIRSRTKFALARRRPCSGYTSSSGNAAPLLEKPARNPRICSRCLRASTCSS